MKQVVDDVYVEISYVIATGGSGSVRRWLSEVPAYLEKNPGMLIYRIRLI